MTYLDDINRVKSGAIRQCEGALTAREAEKLQDKRDKGLKLLNLMHKYADERARPKPKIVRRRKNNKTGGVE